MPAHPQLLRVGLARVSSLGVGVLTARLGSSVGLPLEAHESTLPPVVAPAVAENPIPSKYWVRPIPHHDHGVAQDPGILGGVTGQHTTLIHGEVARNSDGHLHRPHRQRLHELILVIGCQGLVPRDHHRPRPVEPPRPAGGLRLLVRVLVLPSHPLLRRPLKRQLRYRPLAPPGAPTLLGVRHAVPHLPGGHPLGALLRGDRQVGLDHPGGGDGPAAPAPALVGHRGEDTLRPPVHRRRQRRPGLGGVARPKQLARRGGGQGLPGCPAGVHSVQGPEFFLCPIRKFVHLCGPGLGPLSVVL
mmetsp:Transcript_38135/g.85406  ORF Transcript_38135/g.85406 Transcript_38135/m.85406 type:complete len:301 (-) Transcript_38135:285-1187(-)